MRIRVRVHARKHFNNINNLIFKMSMKTIETVRERYEIPACEELDVRIEQSILSNTPQDEEYNDQGDY